MIHNWSSSLMHRYLGTLTYSNNNSGRKGREVKVELTVSFFPGRCAIIIQDEDARTRHVLTNKRFNYQARDSPVDLLARDKWRSYWHDRFVGSVYLACPRITRVPRELYVNVICSWDPAFGVIEFRLDDTYYQISVRPPRGCNSWARGLWDAAMNHDETLEENAEPSSSSQQPPINPIPIDSPARLPPWEVEADAEPIGINITFRRGVIKKRYSKSHPLLNLCRVHGKLGILM